MPIIRYAAVGSFGLLWASLILYVLTELVGAHYWLAGNIALSAGLIHNFLLNKFWTFGDPDPRIGKQFLQSLATYASGYLIVNASFLLLTDKLGVWYFAAFLMGNGTAVIWNYCLHAFLIFRKTSEAVTYETIVDNQRDVELTIGIPCYQEQGNIARLALELIPVLQTLPYSYEILLIDDGSTDLTFAESEAFARNEMHVRILRHLRNAGLGASIKTAIREARGRLLIILDADLTFHPREIPKLLRRYEENGGACVIGSHFLGDIEHVPMRRLIITKVANFLYRIAFGARLTAYTPLFRLYETAAVRSLPIASNDFSVSAEILFHLLRSGARITEVPVTLGVRVFGESKIVFWKELWNHARLLLRVIVYRLTAVLRGAVSHRKEFSYVLVAAFALYITLWAGSMQVSRVQRDLHMPEPLPIVAGGDSAEYKEFAENLLERGAFTLERDDFAPNTLRTPGYPFFIALIFAVFHSYFAVTLAQIVLSLATALLLYMMLRDALGRRVATVAALLFLFDVTAILQALVLLSDTLFTFLFAAFVYLLFFRKVLTPTSGFLGGVVLGAAIMVRPIAMYFPAIGIVLLFLLALRGAPRSPTLKTLIASSVAALIGVSAVLLPWMLRNYQETKIFGLTSLGTYSVLYFYIAPHMAEREGISLIEAQEKITTQLGPNVSNPEDIRYESRLSATLGEYVREHFFSYALFHIEKTSLFFLSSGWRAAMSAANTLLPYDIVQFSPYGILNAIRDGNWSEAYEALTHDHLLFADRIWWLFLTTAGFYALLRGWKNSLIILFWVIVLYFALLSGPVSIPRLRLPAEPFMFALAAIGATYLYRDLVSAFALFANKQLFRHPPV